MFADYSGKQCAVVVAHCDDESLWSGGLVGRYGAGWSIICCSIPRSDPIRAWKFFDAVAVMGGIPRLLPFTESEPNQDLQHLGSLELSPFDLIVTHNAHGEYGHHQHRQIHEFIVERWADKTATFGYRPDTRGSIVLHLTADEQARKLAALRCYDHVAPADGGKPKWQALLDRYQLDFRTETFDPPGV